MGDLFVFDSRTQLIDYWINHPPTKVEKSNSIADFVSSLEVETSVVAGLFESDDGELMRRIVKALAHANDAEVMASKLDDLATLRRHRDGATVLHLAAFYNRKLVVKWLLKNRWNWRETDNSGNSCLHMSAMGGSFDAASIIIQHIQDIGQTALLDTVNSIGDTSLWLCLSRYYERVAMLFCASGSSLEQFKSMSPEKAAWLVANERLLKNWHRFMETSMKSPEFR